MILIEAILALTVVGWLTAAAGPVERPVRLDPERAWLVEWRFNGTQWLYLTGGSFNFTADPNRALRLARRADAEAAMQWAIEFDRRLGLRPTGELLVTEHEWPNAELTGTQRSCGSG